MISVNPQGQIYLCKTPLENDYEHQLTFTSSASQLSYFNSIIEKTYDNYIYIKENNQIKVGSPIDEIKNLNYLFYKNTGFTSKFYFCFITNMEYINENCTLITFETDIFQTYQFDIIYKKSFVEREHVNSDAIGENTIPENLELGEYMIQDVSDFDLGDFYICVAVSDDILRADETIVHNSYNGIVSGLTYIVLKTQDDVNYLIFRYNNEGKIDAINSLFMIPEGYILPITNWLTDSTGTINYVYVGTQDSPFDLGNITITKPSRLGESEYGYLPKNNKLFTYPYCYLMADNNAGQSFIYRYEEFSPVQGLSANSIKFDAIGSINAGCTIKIIPNNYKFLIGQNFAHSFNNAKIPIGGWINDVYTNWLTQNGVNLALSGIGSGLQIVGGLSLGKTESGSFAGSGNVASGILGIASTLGQIYQHSLIPDQAEGNVNSSDIMFSKGKIAPSFYRMCIKEEYLKIIDNYFSMFGYKVNSLKLPNITGRAYYNYVKTLNCNIDGDIPQEAILKLKDMFNKGCTFWHNPNNFLNYDVTNNIVV